MMIAVGEHVLGELDERMIRMATGLGGGVGMDYQDLCGAFLSGVLIIGACHGRTTPEVDDGPCQEKVRAFRQRFEAEMGSLICGELREEKYGSGGEEPCSVLVERAAAILLEIV
ncbi:MAG: C-GCAxxG-C-C family protein [Anaerolineales bacterium]